MSGSSGEPYSFTEFSDRYRAFLTNAIDSVGNETTLRIAELLRDPDTLYPALTGLLGLLRTLSDERQLVPHETVDHCLSVLRESFAESRPFFLSNSLIAVVYGSLQYRDPYNLDFDVDLIGPTYLRTIRGEVDYVKTKVGGRWPTPAGGHMVLNTLDICREFATLFMYGSHQDISSNAWDIHAHLSEATIALTGIPLFPEDTALLSNYRADYSSFATWDPLFTAIYVQSLEDTYARRLRRAAGGI